MLYSITVYFAGFIKIFENFFANFHSLRYYVDKYHTKEVNIMERKNKEEVNNIISERSSKIMRIVVNFLMVFMP